MLKKIIKIILILTGFSLVIFAVWWITLLSVFGVFDKDYSVAELIENFNKNKKEIYELRDYYNSIVPINRFVEIEFEDENTLSRFGIMSVDSITRKPKKTIFLDWDLSINSKKADSIFKSLNWTESTLNEIKTKLEKANCIQIESGEPTKIGFQRSGMGMYYFNVFKNPISTTSINKYNDSCTYIYVDQNLVLEYGSGAIGPWCFYDIN